MHTSMKRGKTIKEVFHIKNSMWRKIVIGKTKETKQLFSLNEHPLMLSFTLEMYIHFHLKTFFVNFSSFYCNLP